MRRVLVINDFASRGGAEEVYRTTLSTLRSMSDVEARGFDGSLVDVPDTAMTRLWNAAASRALDQVLMQFKPHVVWLHNYHNFLSPSILGPIRQHKRREGGEVWQTCHDYMPVFFSPEMLYHEGATSRVVPVEDLGTLRSVLKPSSRKGWKHDWLKKAHWATVNAYFAPRRLIDRFLCPSPFLLEVFRRAGLAQSSYFPNPIDTPPSVAQRTRALQGRGLRLAFAGRLSYEKGLRELLSLAASIGFQGIQDITLYGDGPQREALETEFGQAMASGRLIMAGRLAHEALQAKMTEHDALILASTWYENAPMVIPEAARNGVPILVRNFGSMSSFGEDIGNKILFEATQEGLREALQRLEVRCEQVPAPVFDLRDYTLSRYEDRIAELLSTAGGG